MIPPNLIINLSEGLLTNNELLLALLGSQGFVAIVNYFAQRNKIKADQQVNATDEWKDLYDGAKKDIKEKSDIIKRLQEENQQQAKEINQLWARIQDRQ